MTGAAQFRFPVFTRPIIVIVGGFGSGKTEVAVNLAKYLAAGDKDSLSIVDLDLVNPYFRSREVTEEMTALGITTIAPQGGQRFADLPILLPEIKGLIEKCKGRTILDVGGDEQGTKALGSLSEYFLEDSYELLMVLNSRRPQTDTVDISIKTLRRIERTAKLKFTGLISNSHLLDETTPEIVLEGYVQAKEISRESDLPVSFVSAREDILRNMDTTVFDCAVLPLSRSMLKPWERK